MKIGIFTDTYFPQISGVATSIKTLKDELEKKGHTVYIFTTTDPLVAQDSSEEAENIIRFRSIPFISMPERRFVTVGLPTALKIAKQYELDLVHTQTEFGMGILGKLVANRLNIPVIHTLHTKYEDYLHYIARGHLLRPGSVKYIIRTFLTGTEGLICPSEMTEAAAIGYGVKVPIRIIPTGVEIDKFKRPDIRPEDTQELREKLGVQKEEILLLSLARLSFEKNIQAALKALPQILSQAPVKLAIVGEGPYKENLRELVDELNLQKAVSFVGEVPNAQAVKYYKAADFLISASTSETQGLTFSEALASGTPVLASENPYLSRLIDHPQFGRLFARDEDIADVVISAIRNKIPWDAHLAEEKIFEVSSDHFGQEVIDFYAYMIADYRPLGERARDSLSVARKSMVKSAKRSRKRTILQAYRSTQRVSKLMQKYVKIEKNKKKDKH